MAITYYAHLTTETGKSRIFCEGQDYEAVAAKLEAYRTRHFAKHQVWLGGFVLSYR
jgi:hypothetical protein